jgi:hypothetical protein
MGSEFRSIVQPRNYNMRKLSGIIRGAGISIIGGADIHIFVFCPINFF